MKTCKQQKNLCSKQNLFPNERSFNKSIGRKSLLVTKNSSVGMFYFLTWEIWVLPHRSTHPETYVAHSKIFRLALPTTMTPKFDPRHPWTNTPNPATEVALFRWLFVVHHSDLKRKTYFVILSYESSLN